MAKKKQGIVWKALDVLSGFGIAVVVLVFLTLIVWLGTLAQVDKGLFEVQKEYFESFGLIYWFHIGELPIGVPLPGGYLLMLVLFINMTCALILRMRKDRRRIGMLVVHSSVLFLLVASWVSFRYKTEGNMMLWPGERSALYRSYNNWSIEVKELGDSEDDVLVIPEAEFGHLDGDKSRTFYRDGLPFELNVSHYSRNASLRKAPADGGGGGGGPVARGAQISPEPLDPTAEANVGAVFVEIEGSGVKSDRGAILWAGNDDWKHEVEMEDGSQYLVELVRHGWSVPYEIELEKFTRVLHPNTGLAKEFNSRVTRISGDEERDVLIEMNEPLRHEGFTFFQANWGPQNDPRATEFYTVLAVVKNPSDQWPKYFIYIVTLGLVVHFIEKLMRSSSRTVAAKGEEVAS